MAEDKWLAKARDAMKNKAAPGPTLAEKTAADWIRPGGGYDQWKKGDPGREKRLPIGGMEPTEEKPVTPIQVNPLQPRRTPLNGDANK